MTSQEKLNQLLTNQLPQAEIERRRAEFSIRQITLLLSKISSRAKKASNQNPEIKELGDILGFAESAAEIYLPAIKRYCRNNQAVSKE